MWRKNSLLFEDTCWKVNCPYCKFTPLFPFLFLFAFNAYAIFACFSVWNVTCDVSGRKAKKPAASSCGKFLRRVNRAKGEKKSRDPCGKFSSTRGNSTGTVREEWTSSPSFFSFSRSISALGSLRRATKESLRASSAGIYKGSSLSFLPPIVILKCFTFTHLKSQAESEFLGRGISSNIGNPLTLRRIGWRRLRINALSRKNICGYIFIFLYNFI